MASVVARYEKEYAIRVAAEWSQDGGVTWTSGHKILVREEAFWQWRDDPANGATVLDSASTLYRVPGKTVAELFAPLFEIIDV